MLELDYYLYIMYLTEESIYLSPESGLFKVTPFVLSIVRFVNVVVPVTDCEIPAGIMTLPSPVLLVPLFTIAPSIVKFTFSLIYTEAPVFMVIFFTEPSLDNTGKISPPEGLVGIITSLVLFGTKLSDQFAGLLQALVPAPAVQNTEVTPLTVIAEVLAVDEPQLLFAVTLTLPDEEPKFTAISVLPAPDFQLMRLTGLSTYIR